MTSQFSTLNLQFTYLPIFQATLLEFWSHENARGINLQHLGLPLENKEKAWRMWAIKAGPPGDSSQLVVSEQTRLETVEVILVE